MKKIIVFSLIAFVPQLYSISLIEYMQLNGTPEIQGGIYGNTLDLSNKNLTDLTGLESIPYIQQVRRLYLSHNQLQTLPANTFSKLSNLITLSLANNQLDILPATIFKGLNKLRWLFLNNNQLQKLPEAIFDGLHNLYMLDVRGNSFDLDFIPTLTEILQKAPYLSNLNGKSKDEALKQVPFSTLKQSATELIVHNIEDYRTRLEELPLELKEDVQCLTALPADQ